jgi:hypothetical protein
MSAAHHYTAHCEGATHTLALLNSGFTGNVYLRAMLHNGVGWRCSRAARYSLPITAHVAVDVIALVPGHIRG